MSSRPHQPPTQNFPVFQHRDVYEAALARHGQSLRWMRGITCTCISSDTSQADPSCLLCYGRGVRYSAPESSQFNERVLSVDGLIILQFSPIGGVVTVFDERTEQQLAVTSVVQNRVQLSSTPSGHSPLLVSYNAGFQKSVVNVLCTVVDSGDPNYLWLQPGGVDVRSFATAFEVSILTTPAPAVLDSASVTVPVLSVDRNLLRIARPVTLNGPYRASFSYIKPFKFLLHSVSEKMKWDTGYVAEEADAVLVVPWYIKLGVQDVVTMLSGRQAANAVLMSTAGVTDPIRNYFDVVELVRAYNASGVELDISKASIVNRNEILWQSGFRPTGKYSIQFLYRPTFVVLPSLPTLRNAEDSAFVNRVSVSEYTRLTGTNTF